MLRIHKCTRNPKVAPALFSRSRTWSKKERLRRKRRAKKAKPRAKSRFFLCLQYHTGNPVPVSKSVGQGEKQVFSERCMHVHAAYPFCMFMLHIPSACSCCISLLHVHAAYPFCMFMLLYHASCSCCISEFLCRVSVPRVRAVCPCLLSMLLSMLNAHASRFCCMSIHPV